ncbi:MAG: hypothetical protein NTW87_02100 [Planctomycetota bacterium]|nr:hypothetical protein [Planctomycetota bacterium]
MSVFLVALPEWLRRIEWVDRLWRLPWERIPELYIGEQLALGTLLGVTVLGCAAAANRFLAGHFSWPKPRKAVKAPKRKRGVGIKWLVLGLIALLPGGLVGTAAVYAIMGKENWRHDALRIVGVSMVPAGLLALLRAEGFPWPELREGVYGSATLGLIFGLLHVWAMIKLLRQWWGEPDECVPWWPPAALCLQVLILFGAAVLLLEPK